ncbi:HNH endonuclease [Streptomyces sp. NPDC005407]|uniref:HNH endonuclease n=1 Tax=Streptomyces sp. NPDC005407 TaxID=3155340 RepID=UPI0033AEB3CC
MSRHRAGCVKGERGRALRYRLARRDGRQCFYCRTPFPDITRATLDHYLPYSWWATNRPFNLVLACEPCNTRKGDTFPLGLLLVLRTAVHRDALGVAA